MQVQLILALLSNIKYDYTCCQVMSLIWFYFSAVFLGIVELRGYLVQCRNWAFTQLRAGSSALEHLLLQ